MATYRDDWRLTACFKGIGAMVLVGGCAIATGNPALAQVTPDATLGAEGSVVTSPIPGGFLIDGGATRGTNLFHSFSQFSIPTNGIALFNNALTIQNIISRVTGASLSNIDGLIGANGTANLFLINPNGIIFGPNATLNIGGSFLASTANSLVFGNGFEFSATNPQAPPLLTINVPLGLQMGTNPGRIVNQSSVITQSTAGLTLQPGRTLALVGGDIAMEGGILYAPDGRIEMGSVAGNSRVNLTPTDTGYALSYGGVENFQDIRLTQEAIVATDGESGGSIQVQGRNVTLIDGSQIRASTLGGGKGRGLIVNASDSVQVIGSSANGLSPSALFTIATPNSTGDAGNLTLTTSQLLLQDEALVGTGAFGSGKGGNLIVNASDSVQVIGSSAGGLFPSGLFTIAAQDSTGDAGNLTLTTSQLLLQDGGQVAASTLGSGKGGDLIVNASDSVQATGSSANGLFPSGLFSDSRGAGDAGDLTLTTSQLLLQDGGQVGANTFGSGKGGNLIVNASDSVQATGSSANALFLSGLFTTAAPNSTGDAGNLTLTTSRLLLQDGGQVGVYTFGSGKGGNLIVNASNSVQAIGNSADGRRLSGLFTIPAQNSTGDAGNLTLTTSQLLLQDGGQVGAYTFGSGKGGNLIVNASNSVQAIGNSADGVFPSGLFSDSRGAGDAGNLTLTTSQLLLQNGGQVAANTVSSGKGGNLIVNASDSVQAIGTSADGRISGLFAIVTQNSTGNAGNLTLTTSQLLLQDGGQMSTSTYGSGKGGELIVNASDSVQAIGISTNGQSSSGLFAQAYSMGEAGNLTVTTERLLIQDGAQVNTGTLGTKGGNLTVNASDSVQVMGRSATELFPSGLFAQAGANSMGDSGNITITTGKLLIQGGAQVSASTFTSGKGGNLSVNASDSVQVIGTSTTGQFFSGLGSQAGPNSTGNAGDLRITTSNLLIRDGAQVSASTFGAGKGGNLIVNASDSVQVIGESADGRFFSGLGTQAEPNSIGKPGNLLITTGRLLIQDGAQVSTSTYSSGKGGSLTVNASESVQVIGHSATDQAPSGLFTRTQGTGDAGDLTITTQQLFVQDGAEVDAATFSTGAGGNLIVNASDSVQLTGAGGLFVNATAGGTAGNLSVKTRQMSVRDGAQVTVSSPSGQAGNLTITADSLTLNRGRLTAVTGKSGAEGGANITLQGLDLLRMDNESLVSASALEEANGGNVNIDSTFIVATPPTGSNGSDIIANAVRGNGGRVNITTQGLFGIQFRPKQTPDNDITASSEFGINGEVTINQPDVDPRRGLTELPTTVVDATRQIDRRCAPARADQRSSFVVTGRGGLPPSPNDPLQGEAVITNWVTLDSKTENTNIKTPKANSTSTPPQQLVEAQSWVYDADGQVILVAQAPTATPQSPWQTSPSCRDLQTSVKSVGREEKILH